MKIAFISNFLNHHQLPFCIEMKKKKNIEFYFIATEPIDKERIKLGYEDMNTKYDFVIRTYDNEKKACELIDNSDVVIIGSAPQKYIERRLKTNKLTFRYSERIFKDGFDIKTWLALVKNFSRREKNVYLLCSSAYTAYDYNRAFCFKNRTYKWGYFPEIIKYNVDKLLKEKQKNKAIQLLWVGRFIGWKHPEKAVFVAKRLKEIGINFNLKMVGTGDKIVEIDKLIKENNLEKDVELIGAVNYKIVRKYMEKANIYLFTSDYNEGWGAVLNEALNSGCVVIASHAIGSVPFVLKNNYNGLIYKDDDLDSLITKVCDIIKEKKKQYEIGYNAYNTVASTWNSKNAANRLIELIQTLSTDKNNSIKEGPCSVALPISNKRMYNYLLRGADDKENSK